MLSRRRPRRIAALIWVAALLVAGCRAPGTVTEVVPPATPASIELAPPATDPGPTPPGHPHAHADPHAHAYAHPYADPVPGAHPHPLGPVRGSLPRCLSR